MCRMMWMLLLLAVSYATNAADPDSPQIQTPKLPVLLRKCFCGAGEAWDGSKCVALQDTPVPLMHRQHVLLINSTEFAHVRIEEITCQHSTVLLSLDIENGLFVSTNTSLNWYAHLGVFSEYCVEHTPEFEVHVCLQAPQIPRCCPPEHVLEKDFSCLPRAGTNFTPPVILDSHPIQFPDTHAIDAVEDVSCEGLAVPHRVDLTDSGSLVYDVPRALLQWFPPSEYNQHLENTASFCVGVERGEAHNEQNYVAKLCYYTDLAELHRHTCANATCVRKCCPENKMFIDLNNRLCHPTGSMEMWQPSVHWNQTELPSDLAVVYGMPLCKNTYSPVSEHRLQQNGTLHVAKLGAIGADKYCFDFFLSTQTGQIEKVTLICNPEKDDECHWRNVMVLVLLCISCLFLFATLVIYLSVAELRNRTNGRCLISLVSAMIATYFSLVINQESRSTSDEECYAMSFVGHVCTLATFFWLNVMCFDMWSTLRSSRQKYQSMKVFVFYSIYAWGCPLLVGIVALVLDLVKPPGVIRPGFVTSRCWFNGNKELWSYLSGIILLLLVANLFFFIHVAVTLVKKLKQRQAVFDNEDSHASNADQRNREQILLFIRLFIVMGVSWIAEIISTIHKEPCDIWILTDILNGLQGVLIFGVAVCNKDNIKKIQSTWHKRMTTLRRTDQFSRLNQGKRVTDLSMAASEASRKTSVTSIPRKNSTAANAFFPNNSLSDQSIDSTKRATGPSAPRKISAVTPLEMIPMTPVEE